MLLLASLGRTKLNSQNHRKINPAGSRFGTNSGKNTLIKAVTTRRTNMLFHLLLKDNFIILAHTKFFIEICTDYILSKDKIEDP